MNLQLLPLVIGMLSGIVPVAATLLRGRSPFVAWVVGISVVTSWLYFGTQMRLLLRGSETVDGWLLLFIASGIPILLAGYLVARTIGRDDPSLHESRGTFVLLALAGIVFALLIRHPSFVMGYDTGRSAIYLGAIGKAYLSYLLVGLVVIGFNLESTYRLASSEVRHRLKLPFLGILAALGYLTFVLTTGLLYSSLGVGKLVAAGLPTALANLCLGYGYLRGSLSDVAAPVSRNVVYTSFSIVAASMYVFAVGLVAQIATLARWSADEVFIVSVIFLGALFGLALLISNRFQRRVRRFIDRNFYVNRYDYRTQWFNLTKALDRTLSEDDVLRSAHDMVHDSFAANDVTIAVRDDASLQIRPRIGKGIATKVALTEDSPLFQRLQGTRESLLLERHADDFELIPIYAENEAWLDATASRLIAPLMQGTELIGCIGLERHADDDSFSFEDAALLESVAAHVASELQSVRLLAEVAESSEMQLMSQWSSMILHDLKNYLAPMRLIARNLIDHRDKPNVGEIAAQDLENVANRMEALVQTLSELRQNPQIARERLDINSLLQEALDEMQLARRDALQVDLDLRAGAHVLGDAALLRRVIENLVTNAVEAMSGKGKLAIQTRYTNGDETRPGRVQVTFSDTGVGVPDELVRRGLFKPFATTKPNGTGLGLYQCRSIVRAHGGQLTLESQVDHGTTVELTLEAEAYASSQTEPVRPDIEPSGEAS